MIVTAIAAMSRTGVIGDGVRMPWHLPRDLRRFRDATMGKPIIMGRRTLESLRGPLPGRLNIALSRSPDFRAEGFRIAGSLDEALRIAEEQGSAPGEAMIIGGGVIYEASFPLWDRLLLTVVEGEYQGSTHFPIDRALKDHWRLVNQEYSPPDARNVAPHWFLHLERERNRTVDLASASFDLAAWLQSTAAPPTTNLPPAPGS